MLKVSLNSSVPSYYEAGKVLVQGLWYCRMGERLSRASKLAGHVKKRLKGMFLELL